jgi:hypothetical protein
MKAAWLPHAGFPRQDTGISAMASDFCKAFYCLQRFRPQGARPEGQKSLNPASSAPPQFPRVPPARDYFVRQHHISQNMNAPNDITKRCFDTLLAATAADDFEQFVSVGDEQFKRGLKPEVFHRVSRSLAPRLQKGVAPTFLGELRQSSYIASLWRLRFDEGGDDLLFRMALADSKVAGALVAPTFS